MIIIIFGFLQKSINYIFISLFLTSLRTSSGLSTKQMKLFMAEENLYIQQSSQKLGLALSGGGFRASLFHIGVLAKMAELNMLKEVQVISMVSGGSIIGALYYLKIKELLEGKRNDGLPLSNDPSVYIKIVEEIGRDFLAAVQKNIRLRTFLNPVKNMRMLSADYSRSDRIGELYTKHIYEKVWENISNPKDRNIFLRSWNYLNGNPQASIFLRDLKIFPDNKLWPPQMRSKSFDFDEYQKYAEFKIPALVINATTLNTGNCWQFTAVSVGEIPPTRQKDIPKTNVNNILPKLYFQKSNDHTGFSKKEIEKRKNKLHGLELGDAVAASAGVPGIFPPFSIHHLYKINNKDYTVQLVDGGVYDNQGISTLVTQWECTDIICSDASGQLTDDPKPSSKEVGVIQRSNDVLMDRVRDYEVYKLFNNHKGKRVFMHLRDDSANTIFQHLPPDEKEMLKEYLANIRTDLDSFTDIEGYSLMHFGYKMSEEHLRKEFGRTGGQMNQWRFLEIENHLNKTDGKREKVLKQLKVSNELLFKIFRLNKSVAVITIVLLLAILGWLVYLFHSKVIIPELTVARAGAIVLVTALMYFLDNILSGLGKWVTLIRKLRFGFGPAVVMAFLPVILTVTASLLVFAYLKIYNRLYISQGKIKRSDE